MLGGNLVLVLAYKKDKGKETMLEVSKRLTEQNIWRDVTLENIEKQSLPNTPVATDSGLPPKPAKPPKASLERQSSRPSPMLSPKFPSSSPNINTTSPQLPKKLLKLPSRRRFPPPNLRVWSRSTSKEKARAKRWKFSLRHLPSTRTNKTSGHAKF